MARICLEYCRFAYKMYAQSCQFPMDPFYEAWGAGFKLKESARDRLMQGIHDSRESIQSERKFDPLLYHWDRTPHPHKGVVYRGGTDTQYILFHPRHLDRRISHAQGFDLIGTKVDRGHQLTPTYTQQNALRCAYFQGRTGMTQNHPNSGWPSYLGAVLYDPTARELYIVFRGSRSGDGTRALLSAQTKSRGSPDWVTDMNHLKAVQVSKYGGSTLAAGFHYAYESCVTSLKAAYQWAVQGTQPQTVYVTGHSLGGALAQCAYLDLTCGTLGQTLDIQDGAVDKFCFPISAPPVAIGRESQHWLSRNADAAGIHHYYNPKDAVHACDLVTPGTLSKANSAVKFGSHPLTQPYHLGSQVALDCNAEFPDAHEPELVWRSLYGQRDTGFWPTFTMDVVTDSSLVAGLADPGLMPQLKEALKNSCSIRACIHRAEEWKTAIKKDKNQVNADQDLAQLTSAMDVLNSTELVQNALAQNSLRTLRQQLVTRHGNPSKHSASSSVSYTLLLGLAVRQVVAL
ncbi:MAG: hypothetical protein ABW123_26780 [Cystobacter sp.]